jgi:hypothetical protein
LAAFALKDREDMDRSVKITFGEMRASGIEGVVVYCQDYRCSHSVTLSADASRMARGERGADVRPDFAKPIGMMGCR